MANGNRPKWTFCITNPNDDTVCNFKSIGALCMFLEEQMDAEDSIQLAIETGRKDKQ